MPNSIPVDLPREPLAPGPLTALLQQAIDAAGQAGGGTVSVGPGTWIITTLVLRSGVELHLRQDAVLQAATDLTLYPAQPGGADNKDQSHYHLIFADHCEDIAIRGEGTIDGQDTAFWTPAATEAERPYGIFNFYVTGERISPLVQIAHCQRVTVEGVTLRRSPGWTLHLFDCDDVAVIGVKIRNHLSGPNADGITINGCRNATVLGCDIVTGDDAIGVKATDAGIPCHDVQVRHCQATTNCGAFILGAETLGGISHVSFENCVAHASLRMIAIELWDAGHVDTVVFRDIRGRTFPEPDVFCERPIYVDIQEFLRPGGELGHVKKLYISDIHCTTRGRIVLTAQDGSRIEDVMLSNIHLEVPDIEDPQAVVPAARSWQNSNFNPETRAARAAVVADNVHGLTLLNVTVNWPASSPIPMEAMVLRHVENLKLESLSLVGNRIAAQP